MDVILKPEDTHPSGLLPVSSQPLLCSNKNVNHKTDSLKELHGSKEKPIEVPHLKNGKYVSWEYDHMTFTMTSPYKRCLQELLTEESTGRMFDRLVVRDIAGNHHVFYFEVTARLAEEKERMVKVVDEYLAGKPVNAADREAIEAAIRIKDEAKKRENL